MTPPSSSTSTRWFPVSRDVQATFRVECNTFGRIEVGVSALTANALVSDSSRTHHGADDARGTVDPSYSVIGGVREVELAVRVNCNVAWEVKGCLRSWGVLTRKGRFAIPRDGNQESGPALPRTRDPFSPAGCPYRR